MNNKYIYFDHASTSPLSKDVLKTINYSFDNYWGNVSSTYKFGIDCSAELETIRKKISILFNSKPEDIIFTSGASESISIVFNAISDYFSPSSITISTIEHQSTNIVSNKLKKRGWNIKKWPVDNQGVLKTNLINKFINSNTKLVSIIWGQSEIGSLQPIQYVGERCTNNEILFHVDGTQIISNGIFNWESLNCDLLSLSAHKFGGPKGIGILFTNKKSREILINQDISLTQEYSIRQGTQPLALISGLYKALENISSRICMQSYDVEFKENKTIYLKNYFLEKIKNNKYFEITGSTANRLPNHISFILLNKNLIPIKAFKVINYMSDHNISISSGSACSSSSNKPSSTLANIGFNKSKLYSNIRLSFNEENTHEELDKFYNLILDCINIF
tara:strand:- start:3415 stop:4587 length:1173 start_codon:yes stop_codon:yes gene_type:complete